MIFVDADITGADTEIKILNVVGNIIFEKTFSENDALEINVSSFEAGLYFMNIKGTNISFVKL